MPAVKITNDLQLLPAHASRIPSDFQNAIKGERRRQAELLLGEMPTDGAPNVHRGGALLDGHGKVLACHRRQSVEIDRGCSSCTARPVQSSPGAMPASSHISGTVRGAKQVTSASDCRDRRT